MATASELTYGMVVRVEGQIYKVLKVESKAASAKLGGVVKAELSNIVTGRLWEVRFRPQAHVEDLQVERRNMEFLFSEGATSTFMDVGTFEQVEVPGELLGVAVNFLHSGTGIRAELPEIVEARVVHTAAPTHSQQDSAWKEATLENGITIRVPLFIAPEERVKRRSPDRPISRTGPD